MKTEIEAKWLEIDHETIAKTIKDAGGKLIAKKTPMIRTVFNTGDKHSWVRVRDEGDKITLSYKRCEDAASLVGTKEICIEVSDYNEAVELLKEIGLHAKSVEETKREIWELDGAEIVLDEWPWIPPIIEIETEEESQMPVIARRLGLDMKEAMYSGIDMVYPLYYDVTSEEVNAHKDFWKEMRFGPIPKGLEAKRKIK